MSSLLALRVQILQVLANMDNVTQQLHAEFGSTNRFSFKNKAQAKQYAQTVLQRKMELEKGFGIPHRNIRFATILGDDPFASYVTDPEDDPTSKIFKGTYSGFFSMLGLTQLSNYLTLKGSFSAVSKPHFASKYAFESSRRDLHNALLCTVL